MKQDITKRRQVDEITARLKFDSNNDKKYKVEAICNSAIYAGESRDHLLSLYYLVS